MTHRVLVEVLRGGIVESFHRGAFAIADAAGTRVHAVGDATTLAPSRG